MSYLNDEPLNDEEERFLKQSERRYNYQQVPPPPDTLRVRATLNQNRADYGINDFRRIFHDYIKIKVRESGQFLINQRTYDHLLNNIKGRFQHNPINDLLVCDSIVIVPVPNHRCSLYFYPHKNREGEEIEMELVGSFVCDNYLRKLPVSCPYSDSFFGPGRKVSFNWYGNDKQGKIIPKTIEMPDIELSYNNKSVPFLSPHQKGSYLITGICDTIAFHVSFNVDVSWNYRFGRRYNRRPRHHPPRQVHIPRQIIGDENEIHFEIPSQDIIEEDYEEDPLLRALEE